MRLKIYCLFILAALFLSACSKKMPEYEHAIEGGTIRDLQEIPQDLMFFAKKSNPGSRLLTLSQQQELTENFLSVFFGPWNMKKTAVKKSNLLPLFKKAKGYKINGKRWTQQDWAEMANNANLQHFPSMSQNAIVLRQTDLRELPTEMPCFLEPTDSIKDNPFDYFQYSVLWPGTPLIIAHTAKDKQWHFVECPIASGWVKADDIAFADELFIQNYKKPVLAAIVKEKVNLPGTGKGGKDSTAGIGTVLPFASGNEGLVNVFVPVANEQGRAEMAEISLTELEAKVQPISFTPANMALIGNQMMNQPYGWGGTLGYRDCSLLMRDIFAPFGIWLPRNSSSQAKRGTAISLAGLNMEDKNSLIIEKGMPFLSLLGMKGHIGLYIGKWKDKAAIFHNTWGLRVIKNGNDNERFVIGKTVITTITPGLELKNLYRTVTFADRLRTLTLPCIAR